MGLAFTPQGTTTTPPEITPVDALDVPLNPADDFFEVQQSATPESSVLPPEGMDRVEPETLEEMTPSREVPRQETQAEVKAKPTSRPVPPHPATLTQVDPVTAQIEKIMEEGIGEAYQELTPVQKQQFKIKGEETARNIKTLLQSTKVKIKKIFSLLLEWLKLLPGVNRFFLMQEAKIKTDKILGLKHTQK